MRAALGLPAVTTRVYDAVQQLAIIDDDVLDALGVDTIEVGRAFSKRSEHWADWSLPDGTPAKCLPGQFRSAATANGYCVPGVARCSRECRMAPFSLTKCYWPFAEREDLAQIQEAFAESMWTATACPPGPEESDPTILTEGARHLRQTTDRAVIGLFGGNLMEIGQFLYRMDNFLEMLAGEPRRVHAFLDRLTELHLSNLDRFLNAVGSYIDVVLFGDDLGAQNGPLLSPQMYREFFKPRHKLLWNRAKQLAPVKVMLHCCGSVRALLPDMIDAGLDTINPVQIACRGMDAAGLKRDFGRDITFWGGGCDTQEVLPKGTPQLIRAHVREQIAILSPGGGFIFQQVHNILPDMPIENVLAMFDTVTALRKTAVSPVH